MDSGFKNKLPSCDNYVIEHLNHGELKITELSSRLNELPGNTRSFCTIPYINPTVNPLKINLFSEKESYLFGVTNYDCRENATLLFSPRISKDEYVQQVYDLKKKIQKGIIYEINFCMQFISQESDIDPLSVYIKLQKLAKAPYSKLVKIEEDFIISASPELFLKRTGEIVETKPIKGTARRSAVALEDEMLKKELFNNGKERTENVMAVDVARNDLSRVAEKGTVKVNKLYNIETYETVHHMVSTVSCRLKRNLTFDEIINATFPMASMTGAPKIKAMQLIDETENFERDYYSGAMGFIESNGDFEFSVTIRSIFYNVKTKRVSIAVGSAITHLCDPEKEYEECLLKAGALLKALNAEIKV
ncbi:MAG: Aminodeoxychorismate synthase component [Bacteroidetes bacterium]|nr:Aminodeoxychorismate synthase component [Bacteroidota bacterium]